MTRSGVVVALLLVTGLYGPVGAQEGGPMDGAGATPLTISEAIELALTRSFAVRIAREELAVARGQIDEASVSYTHLTLPTNREV